MRTGSPFSFSWRYGLAVALACAIVGGGVSLLLFRMEREQTITEVGERLSGYSEALARRLNAGLSRWALDVELLTRFEVFSRGNADPAAARRLLEDVRFRSPTFAWIGFVGADGHVIAGTDGLLEGVDVSARPWFQPGLAGLHLGDVHPAVLLARLLPVAQGGGDEASFIDAAAPVRAADGQVTGVVVGHLTWRWAEDVQAEVLSLAPRHPPMRLHVLSADGRVLLGPAEERGQPWVQDPGPAAGPGAGLGAGPGARSWQEATRPGGRDVLLARTPTDGEAGRPNLGWTVVAEVDRAAVLARPDRLLLWLGVGTLGLALLGGLVAGRQAGLIEAALGRGTGGGGRGMATRVRALRKQAWRDPVTDLLNLAGFEAWKEAHPAATRRCTVAVFKLQGIREVQENHGPGIRDEVLAATGAWLLNHLRSEDVAVRISDETLVLVFMAEGERGFQAASRASSALGAMLGAGVPSTAGPMPLRCACATAPTSDEAPTIDEALLLALADLRKTREPLEAA